MSNEVILRMLMKAFECGVDYGQLIMEEERRGEEMFDAMNGFVIAQKYCMPSAPTPRRQLHGAAWFAAKEKGQTDFIELCTSLFPKVKEIDRKEHELFEGELFYEESV